MGRRQRKTVSKTISLREANQGFSRCIREVEAGEKFVVTRKGKPVARIVPVTGKRVLSTEQEAALARAQARMRKGWPIGAGRLNRNELYADRASYAPPRRR